MGNAPLTRLVFGPGLYLMLVALFFLVRLLPLPALSATWPGPDLLLCLTAAWVLRRPDLLPIGLVAAVALLSDLLLQRPPGLWAACLVLVTEYLRTRTHPGQVQAFAGEIATFAALCLGMMVAYWVLLAVFMVPRPGLPAMLAQVPITILAYPAVAVLLSHGLGIRRPTESGRKLEAGRL